MADEPIGDIAPAECALFRQAEAEAWDGLSFDLEAGLADVYARAERQAGNQLTEVPAVPRQRTPASRHRIRVVVLVVLTAFGAVTGSRLLAGGEDSPAEPPVIAAPHTAPPAGLSPEPMDVETSPASRPSRTPPRRVTAAPTPRTTRTTEPQRIVRTTRPAPTRPAPAATRPAPAASTVATPTPRPFRMHYPATSVTVSLADTGPQSLDLGEPKIIDDGPVRITTEPDTGDPVLDNTAEVLAAAVPTAGATPGDCAAAISTAPEGQSWLPLREDRTYCLLAATPAPAGEQPRTLVCLHVERPERDGEITLRMTGWETPLIG